MPNQHSARANLLTDVPGLAVGNLHDVALRSGVTVVLFDKPTVAACAVLGGAPGTREINTLDAENLVEGVDALVLSGGSAFGLDAAGGVQSWLREQGRGLAVGPARVPIVPQAILFDLLNGGDKAWGRYSPYREMGYAATANAAAGAGLALGSAGAGFGATTVTLRGGLGSASAQSSRGYRVAALAAVNALGSPVVGGTPHFWAAPWEENGEFGGLGLPARITPEMRRLVWKGGPAIATTLATTLAVVATDAPLIKASAKRLAIVAHGGLARALRLSAANHDGDTVFAAATGLSPAGPPTAADVTEIAALAADCTARAIARGVYEAAPNDLGAGVPAWKQRFGGSN